MMLCIHIYIYIYRERERERYVYMSDTRETPSWATSSPRATARRGSSGISRIRFSPFYESLCDSSISFWFKKISVFVSSNWAP